MPRDIKVIKKASEAQPGNDLEISTQNDGLTVGLKEANDFIGGELKKKIKSQYAGKSIKFKSIDYTSKGDDESMEVILDDGSKIMVKKDDILPPRLSERELNEIGVYNSETDTANNPKTGENKPDELTGFVEKLINSVDSVSAALEEIKATMEDNSNLSTEVINGCISSLQQYVKSLHDEQESSAQANPS